MYLWSSHLLSYLLSKPIFTGYVSKVKQNLKSVEVHPHPSHIEHPSYGWCIRWLFGFIWSLALFQMGASEAPIPSSYVQLENLRQLIVTHAVTQLCPIKKRLGLTGSFQLRQRHSSLRAPPDPPPLLDLVGSSCLHPKGFSLFPKDLKIQLILKKHQFVCEHWIPSFYLFLVHLFTSFVVRTKIYCKRGLELRKVYPPNAVFLLL